MLQGNFLKSLFARFQRKASEAIEVSFLPSELIEGPRLIARRKSIFAWSLAVCVIVPMTVVGIMFLLTIRAKITSENLVAQVAQAENLVKQSERNLDTVRGIAKKITAAKVILNKHPHWTRVFTFLSENTVSDVSYRGFTADSHGAVVLEASAKNYGAIARQVAIFADKKDFIKEFKIAGMIARFDSQGALTSIDFTASLTLVNDMLLEKRS